MWDLKNGREPTIMARNESEAEEWAIEEWQTRWNLSTKGRHTFNILPSIRQRMQLDHLQIDHFMSQLLTGHGDFAAKLHSFNLTPHSFCECGHQETVEHVLTSCNNYTEARMQWLNDLNERHATIEILKAAITTKSGYKATQEMWKKVLTLKCWPA